MITHRALRRCGLLAFAVAGLQGCSSLLPWGNGSDGDGSSAGSASGSASSLPSAGRPQPGSCLADLAQSGAQFVQVPDSYQAPGCNLVGTVRLSALTGDASRFTLTNIGPVKCEVADAFARWAQFGVDRAARQILGSPLARIETLGSYSCRNIAGTNRRSSHAKAEAIDVSGFVLADGRRIALAQDWEGGTRKEREFLRVVHRSACKRFGTVLGPEYNAAHADHFHLEGTGPRFCR